MTGLAIFNEIPRAAAEWNAKRRAAGFGAPGGTLFVLYKYNTRVFLFSIRKRAQEARFFYNFYITGAVLTVGWHAYANTKIIT